MLNKKEKIKEIKEFIQNVTLSDLEKRELIELLTDNECYENNSDEGLKFIINENGELEKYIEPFAIVNFQTEEDLDTFERLIQKGKDSETLHPLEKWHEDEGTCLWWKLPIEEEQYVGSPLDVKFPNNVTHYTKLIEPKIIDKI